VGGFYFILKQIAMLKTLITLLALFTVSFITAQSSAIRNSDGTWDIELVEVSAKDADWKAITLLVKEGLPAKTDSNISCELHTVAVKYNSDSKKYTLTINGKEHLTTTTVAAIRAAASSELYRKITGKTPPS
jgi:hypothetical protein